MYALLGLSVFLGIPILLIYLGLSIGKKGKKKRIEQFRISYEHALNGTKQEITHVYFINNSLSTIIKRDE